MAQEGRDGWNKGWKTSQNVGPSMRNLGQKASGRAKQAAQNAGSAIQQGWQNVPGNTKIATGVGLMAGLAVGAGRGVGKAHDFIKKKVGKQSAFILIFPFILVALDLTFNQNGVELNSFIPFNSWGAFFGGSNTLFDGILSILSSAPYWALVAIYWIFRQPKTREEWIFPLALSFLVIFTLAYGGGGFWIFYHSLFALFTFIYLLEGFNSDISIGRAHWIFLIVMFMDIFGLATIAKALPDFVSNLAIPELFLNRLLFPLWLFFYLALTEDSVIKKIVELGLVLLYLGIGLTNFIIPDNAFAQQNLDKQRADFQSGIVNAIKNWKDYTAEWLTGRIQYAVTGKVEENQYEPLGVYLENVQPSDDRYYPDEDVVVWGTVKARTLDDPIYIKIGCFIEKGKAKLFALPPYGQTDPNKKFSVFTLEEQDFVCEFNGCRDNKECYLKDGSKTIKTYADFNFETLAYLKVYFINTERQRAMAREGLDVFEEFDISDRNPVAVYTNGPAKIEMGTNDQLVGVSKNYIVEPSLSIKISNKEGWQGKIKKLKELVLFLPEGADLNMGSCNEEVWSYEKQNCTDSCKNFVLNECTGVCEGYITSDDKTERDKCLLQCTKDGGDAELCSKGCDKILGEDYNSCTAGCAESNTNCNNACDSFFKEGDQAYNGYQLLIGDEGVRETDEGIALRCRFRPDPTQILGNSPLTTKSFRVKARYDYSVEKSIAINIDKAEDIGGEGFVGAPRELVIIDAENKQVSDGEVKLKDKITIGWKKSINDGGNSNNVIKYRVYRKDGNAAEWPKSPKETIIATGQESYSYEDKDKVDLTGDFKYSYYVDALNDENNFEKSDKILVVSKNPDGTAKIVSGDNEKLTA